MGFSMYNLARRKILSVLPKTAGAFAGMSVACAGMLPLRTAEALSTPVYQNVDFDIVARGQKVGGFSGRFQGDPSGQFIAATRNYITSDVYSVDAYNVETWNQGILTRLTGEGVNNGSAFRFELSGIGQGLSGSDQNRNRLAVSQNALPTTYWNKDFRRARRVINTTDGTDFGVRATELGLSTIRTAYGEIQVEKVRIRGAGLGLYNVVLSYDANGDWTGLEFSLFGFDVLYQRK